MNFVDSLFLIVCQSLSIGLRSDVGRHMKFMLCDLAILAIFYLQQSQIHRTQDHNRYL